MFLFNETKNKVKIKPIVIYQREIIEVIFFVQRWIFIDAVMPCTSRALRRLLRILKGGINSGWQGFSPLTPNAKIAINKSRKTTQHFFHTPSGLKVIVFHVYPVRGSRVIHSNYHARNMTPSYKSLLGTNFYKPQPFYKSAECWNISYLLVFKSCYEGGQQSLASRE